jgi:hypothetical protein
MGNMRRMIVPVEEAVELLRNLDDVGRRTSVRLRGEGGNGPVRGASDSSQSSFRLPGCLGLWGLRCRTPRSMDRTRSRLAQPRPEPIYRSGLATLGIWLVLPRTPPHTDAEREALMSETRSRRGHVGAVGIHRGPLGRALGALRRRERMAGRRFYCDRRVSWFIAGSFDSSSTSDPSRKRPAAGRSVVRRSGRLAGPAVVLTPSTQTAPGDDAGGWTTSQVRI